MKKRILPFLLTIVMLIGLVPGLALTVLAADGDGTDFDFTDAAGNESGEDWTWNNTAKTLNLNGASITTAVTLPENSTIVAAAGTDSSIVVTGAVPVTTSGDLSISGSGKLTIKALAVGENSAPEHTIVGAESITVTDTELTTYGFAGLSARNVNISNAKVDIRGFVYAILYQGTTGSTSVVLNNVSGSLVSEQDCGIELYMEYNADNSADNKDAAYVSIVNCDELTINGELTRTDKDNSSGHRSAIWIYTRDAETDAYVEIINSNVDINGSGGGIYVNSHSDNSASDDASAAWVKIENSTVDIESATYTWAAIFVNNNGTGEEAIADVTIEDSTVSSKAVHVGIMTSTKNAASTVNVDNSTVTLGGDVAGIRVKAIDNDTAEANVTQSSVKVDGETGMIIDEMDNGVSCDATDKSLGEGSAVAYVAFIDTNGDGEMDEGENGYLSLESAIAAADAGDTIVLLSDVTEGYDVSAMLTIPAGKNIILDLNGKALTSYVMVAADRNKILPQGVLTIQDSGENGTLFGAVAVEGTLNVTGGTLTNNSSDIPLVISVAPDSYANYPVLNITGGTISYTGNSEEGFAISARSTNGRVGDVTITGGTISSTAYSIGANANTKIDNGTFNGDALLIGINEINGGTFNGDVTVQNMPFQTGANGAYVYDAVTSVTDGTFNGKVDFVNEASITGGTFNDEISYRDLYPTNPQKLTISGGTFANDVSAYVAEGYKSVQLPTGVYVVIPEAEFIVTFDPNDGICEVAFAVTESGKLTTLPTPYRNGYTFDGWYLNGTKLTDSTVFTENATVTAEWTEEASDVVINTWYMIILKLFNQEFTITASASEGGTITPEGDSTVKYNERITYTITPDEGCEISAVLVNGEDVGAVSEYTFTRVKKNQTISVIFTEIPDEN